MKTTLRIRTVSFEVEGDDAVLAKALEVLLPAPPPAAEGPPKKAPRAIEGTARKTKKKGATAR